jgi:hypothetical protein
MDSWIGTLIDQSHRQSRIGGLACGSTRRDPRTLRGQYTLVLSSFSLSGWVVSPFDLTKSNDFEPDLPTFLT